MKSTALMIGDRVRIIARGKKQTYVAEYSHEGVHKRTSLKTPNKKVAVERATTLAAELLNGTFRPSPVASSVRDAADDYVRTLITADRAKKTTVKYRGVLANFADFLAARGVTKLDRVTARHFDLYRESRKATRHAKTVYTESVVVKQFFKWARVRQLLTEDPLKDLKLYKPRRESKPAPSMEHVNAFLTTAESPLRDWLAVLAFTGMRVGELQRLRPQDVDLTGNWVYIVSRPGFETKTRMSRKVPIHPRLRPVLESLPRTFRPWLFTSGASEKHPDGHNWIAAKKVNDRFARVVRELGMAAGRKDGIVVHSLRHFFETTAVNAGIPQLVINDWLGHKSDQSMAAVYYHHQDDESQKFMKQVPFGTGGPAANAGGEGGR